MKKILFVRPICSNFSEPELPLNLLILSACLEKEGYKPKIFDYDALKLKRHELIINKNKTIEIIVNDIVGYKPDYVFFTCMCNNFARTISIIKKLKKRMSEVFIGIGGPHVSMCYKDVMNVYHKYIDVVMIGEGEETIIELVNTIETKDLYNVKGICFYKDGVIITPKRQLLSDLDKSPIPAYHLVKMDDYGINSNKTNVYIGSGCPYACSFCTTSVMWERKYRTKSIKRVIEEIEILYRKYGKSDFVFIHDNLTANHKYALNLFSAIKELNLNINYEISSRIDTIDEEMIRMFSESGGKTIFFGIETGSEKMQNRIGKKLKLNKINEILNICKKYGIYAETSFIIGFPDETKQELEKTLSLSFQCRTLLGDKVGINLLSTYPGSPISYLTYNDLYFDEKISKNFIKKELTKEEIHDIQIHKFMYSNYYVYSKYNCCDSASEMRKIFDYVTLVLEKYPYTFNYLLNCLGIHFLDIYYRENYTLDKLSLKDKDLYKYSINENNFINDLNDIVDITKIQYIKEWLLYDSSIDRIYRLSQKNKNSLYYELFSLDISSGKRNDTMIKYALIIGKNGEIYNFDINSKAYNMIKNMKKNRKSFELYLKEEFGFELK